jgi:putative addiction module killer protein
MRRGDNPLDSLYVITYTISVKEIIHSDVFKSWLHKLRDSRARYRIYKRIERLAEGNPGDVEPAGEGISEMRIHYGPGYRVYFKDTGKEIIILLCGGDKSTQQADIIRAKEIALLYEEE